MRVLHVPYGYFPDAVGGTEQYVASLIGEQQKLGLSPCVAAPAAAQSQYVYEGADVFRYVVSGSLSLDDLYGPGDAVAAASFGRLLDRERPGLVHLHAYTSGVSLRVAQEIRDRKIPIVFTYHSPSVSCARGTLMRWGRTPCSGVLDSEPCPPCTVASYGLPQPMAMAAAPVARFASRVLGRSRPEVATAVRMPELVDLRNRCALEFLGLPNRLTVHAEWTRGLLIRNGLNADQIRLIRQGLPEEDMVSAARPVTERSSNEPLRIAFFGRLDPAKGAHLLIEALERDEHMQIDVAIFAIEQEHAYEPYARAVRRRAAPIRRIEIRPPLARGSVIRTMRYFDLVAVPSMVLETGPLVVLEAFAAGVPVIGSKLGGIAELVTDGVNGLLIDPNAGAWAAAFKQLAQQRDLVKQLRLGIRRPRSMHQVAEEMLEVYRSATG